MCEDIYYQAIKPYILSEVDICSYCNIVKPLIVYYGKHFYITVAIGAFMTGYIQLCSYQHRTSATGILKSEYQEFELLSKAIRRSFKRIYGNYGIGFEHGQAGTCLWRENHINSLCHHMHVHYLPIEIDIHEDITVLFPGFHEVHSIQDMVKIRCNVLCAEPYLYFSPSPEIGFMYNVTGGEVPRQFLRCCVAEKLGISSKADWITFPGTEYYDQTLRDLHDIIAEEVNQ